MDTLKRESDKILWRKRIKEIESAVKGLKKRKVTDRIWELRTNTSNKFADKQFVSVRRPDNGELTKSREETFATMLDYNTNLLQKDKDFLADNGNWEAENEEEEMAIRRQKAKQIVIRSAMEMKERADIVRR